MKDTTQAPSALPQKNRVARDHKVSSFLLEVVKNALDTIADELALIIMRTAYSSIVRDAMDYSTAICDANGHTLAQGLTTPLHLGSFFDAMANLVRNHAPTAVPGDVFIFNDPYLAAGQHLPDMYIVRPIFIDGARPRPMYVDYKDLELLGKLVNRQAKILSRRKSGCTAASQHAVTSAIKRARFLALLPYIKRGGS